MVLTRNVEGDVPKSLPGETVGEAASWIAAAARMTAGMLVEAVVAVAVANGLFIGFSRVAGPGQLGRGFYIRLRRFLMPCSAALPWYVVMSCSIVFATSSRAAACLACSSKLSVDTSIGAAAGGS